jgi:hypothetical protein
VFVGFVCGAIKNLETVVAVAIGGTVLGTFCNLPTPDFITLVNFQLDAQNSLFIYI